MSRPRSAPAARGAAAGARPAAQRGVYVQAPKPDIYVALLAVSLGAMIIGCILLVVVLNRYGFSTKVSSINGTHPSTPALALTTDISEKIRTVRL